LAVVRKQGIQNTLVSYLGLVLGFVNIVWLMPRYLGATQIGLTKVLLAIAMLYAQLSAMGVLNITLRYFPYFRDKEARHNGFMTLTLGIAGGGFVLATLFFFGLKPFILEKYHKESPELADYFSWIVPLALFTLLYEILDAYLRSLFKSVVSAFVRDLLLRLMIAATVLVYAFSWITLPQFVALFIIANCLGAVILIGYAVWLGQLHWPTKRFNSAIKSARELFLYGLFGFIGNVSMNIIQSIDSLMLAAFMGLKEVGIYTTAFFMTTALMIPARSVYRIAYPLVSEYWKNEDKENMKILYQKVSLNNLLISGFLFLAIWINIDSLFAFLPAEFSMGKWVFFLISLSRLFDVATGINGIILVTSPNYRADLYFNLILVILVVVGNYIFIPVFGLMGAAWASLLTISTFNFARLMFVYWKFSMQPFTVSCLWIALLGVVIWLLFEFLPHLPNRYLDIMARSFLLVIIYGLPAYYLRLSPDVNAMVGRIVRRFAPPLSRFL
jgi:O-antigen/teichoic acid export membrane protein